MAESGRKKAVEEAADSLRDAILRGAYAPGDRLPGERELSTQLGVSRLTLRSAIAQLQSQGLVRAVHGSGNLVLDYRETGGIDLIGYLAGLAIEDTEVPLSLLGEALELRRMIAVQVIGLAAERATTRDLAELRLCVSRMRERLGEKRAYLEADLAFARAMVRATKNTAFELTFNTVRKVVAENPGLELAYYANAEQTVQVYERLVDLMEKGDGERARQVTDRLLERLDRRTVELIEAFAGSPTG